MNSEEAKRRIEVLEAEIRFLTAQLALAREIINKLYDNLQEGK